MSLVSKTKLAEYRSREKVIEGAVTVRSITNSEEEKETLSQVIRECKAVNNNIMNSIISKMIDVPIKSINRLYPPGSLVNVDIKYHLVEFKFRIESVIYTETMNTLELDEFEESNGS